MRSLIRNGVRMLAVAALIVACGSTVATPAPGGACALVPDMDALVGHTVTGPPAAYELNGVRHCTWVYGADPARYLGLSLGPVDGHSSAIDSLGAGQAVANLGGDARWWAANHLLSVAIGAQSVQVDLELAEADATQDLAERIAREAVGNLH